MTIGDETATTLGIAVARFRLQAFVIAALVTGVIFALSAAVASSGC